MKITPEHSAQIQSMVNRAFEERETVTMSTSGEIGQGNFYGDEPEPLFTRGALEEAIETALEGWTQPEEMTDDEWFNEVTSQILADVQN